MKSDDVIALVKAHLDRGEEIKLSIGKDGRRFVKLCRMVVLGPTYQISGATEATIKRMLDARASGSSPAPKGDPRLA